MNKYVTRRQRQEMNKQKHKNAIVFFAVIAFLVIIGFILLPQLLRNSQKKISKDSLIGSESIVDSQPDRIPDYSGKDYIVLNDNTPGFNEWDIENISGEHYSELDGQGRCGSAVVMLDRSMMPTEKRGEIGQIKPTGWIQKKYEGIIDSEPPYLYNRSHLIAYALTGQNANELNLITGTRYMNAATMLPWEEKVMQYLDYSDNHVLYRVTPYFKGEELLARGVEMEAYSVEDKGEALCYHVFIYNVQPGIVLDYSTGDSKLQR